MKIRMLTGMVCVAAMLGVMAARAEEEKAEGAEKQAPAPSVYVCQDCHVVALEAGKCPKCDKQMTSAHLLGTKSGEAMLCSCKSGCTCDAKEMKDGKCGCGKDVTTASVKGLYVCPDGCPFVSASAGKCACGKELVKAE